MKVTVFEYQRALVYRRGRVAGILEPGRHRLRRRDTVVRTVDVRPAFVTIPGQEVLSADGVALRASIVARYEIADVETALNRVEDLVGAFYLTLQIGLREVIGAMGIEELLSARDRIGAGLVERTTPAVSELGLSLRAADVKDLMLPGELKRIFAQVVEARQEGLAAFERARGESAALRNLANAARAVQDSPALLQLRTLQAITAQPGNTIVLGMPR